MLGVVLEQNLVLPQILFHPPRYPGLQRTVPRPILKPSKRTPEYQTVEAAQRPQDLIFELFDKLLHGVLSCVDELESQRHNLTNENALLFTVYLRRSRAVPLVETWERSVQYTHECLFHSGVLDRHTVRYART